MERRIFEEIRNCTYRGVRGFFTKYFEHKDWTQRSKDIYNAVKTRHIDGRWVDFPDVPVEKAVQRWLLDFQDEFLSEARGCYYTSKTEDLKGAEAQRQLDVFVKPRCRDRSTTVHDWIDVQVIGELRVSNLEIMREIVQLGIYARDIFST